MGPKQLTQLIHSVVARNAQEPLHATNIIGQNTLGDKKILIFNEDQAVTMGGEECDPKDYCLTYVSHLLPMGTKLDGIANDRYKVRIKMPFTSIWFNALCHFLKGMTTSDRKQSMYPSKFTYLK